MAGKPAGDGLQPASGESLEQLLDAAAALRRVAALVTRGASPRETLTAIAREVARFLGADFAGVLRYEPDGTAAAVGWWDASGTGVLAGTRLTVAGEDVAVSVLATGLPAWTDRFDGPAGSVADHLRRLGARSAAGAPITLDGHLWGVAIAAAAQAARLPAGSERRLANLTELVGTAIADAQAQADLHRIADEQAALRRVAVLVAGSAEPADVFPVVAREVGDLLDADVTSMLRFEPDATATILARVGTFDRPALPVGSRRPLGLSPPIEEVFRTGRPARFDDLDGTVGEMADIIRREGLRASVASPIHVGGRLWGAIIASSRRGPFQRGAEQRMADFTELAATAIANAESRAELIASRARIVASFDRARRDIERDLHDGVQQRLVSLALTLRGAQKRVPDALPELDAALSQAAEGLAGVLSELQEVSRGIHPAILSQGGLGPAVKALARRSPVPVELDVRAPGRLPEPVEVAAYYVVAEALANVAKHARASVACVDVDLRDGTLYLRVRDDGVGGADPGRGSGLTGLNDRVAALGGTMRVDSPLGQGTSLTVTLPILPVLPGPTIPA
jgi:signal transduction histidine kinase